MRWVLSTAHHIYTITQEFRFLLHILPYVYYIYTHGGYIANFGPSRHIDLRCGVAHSLLNFAHHKTEGCGYGGNAVCGNSNICDKTTHKRVTQYI